MDRNVIIKHSGWTEKQKDIPFFFKKLFRLYHYTTNSQYISIYNNNKNGSFDHFRESEGLKRTTKDYRFSSSVMRLYVKTLMTDNNLFKKRSTRTRYEKLEINLKKKK